MKKITKYRSDEGNEFWNAAEALRDEGKNVCPKCNGEGVVQEKYNAYPSGLPDSGWVEDWKYRNKACNVCNGKGYTEKKLVPNKKIVIDGYIEE